jgi:hypothetical protein
MWGAKQRDSVVRKLDIDEFVKRLTVKLDEFFVVGE